MSFLQKAFQYDYIKFTQHQKSNFRNFQFFIRYKHDFLLKHLIKLILRIFSKCRLRYDFFCTEKQYISPNTNPVHEVTTLVRYLIKKFICT